MLVRINNWTGQHFQLCPSVTSVYAEFCYLGDFTGQHSRSKYYEHVARGEKASVILLCSQETLLSTPCINSRQVIPHQSALFPGNQQTHSADEDTRNMRDPLAARGPAVMGAKETWK